jgi:hypothetical protein
MGHAGYRKRSSEVVQRAIERLHQPTEMVSSG